MGRQDLFANIETKSESLHLTRCIRLVEALEDPLALILFDTGT